MYQSGRLPWLRVALMGSMLAELPDDTRGQDNCPDVGDAGAQTAALTLKKDDGSCTAEQGGYVKVGVDYRLHIAASTTGGCQVREQDCFPLPCICVNGTYYSRVLGATALHEVTLPEYLGAVQPLNPWAIQAYDTTDGTGTNSTGKLWVPSATNGLGARTFTSQTNVVATPCGLSPTSFPQDYTLTVEVLDCKPEWFTGGVPLVNFHAPPSGAIIIAIPSAAFEDARGPAEAAAADWATGLGRQITVHAGYTTCSPTDGLCVEIKNDHGTKEGDPPGCASFGTATYDADGAWQGSTSVRF